MAQWNKKFDAKKYKEDVISTGLLYSLPRYERVQELSSSQGEDSSDCTVIESKELRKNAISKLNINPEPSEINILA